MKKLMIIALMMLGTSVAFAGKSDALKAVLDAKTYDEAKALIEANLSAMTSNAEKAEAYDKLTKLALAKVSKEEEAMQNNQLVQQFKTGKLKEVDTLGYGKACYEALVGALECEKYDILPNEKGKVKPKYHEINSVRMWPLRIQTVVYAQNIGDNDPETALKVFGTYVDSYNNSLFNEVDKTKQPDTYLGDVARVAAVYAYKTKNMDLANKYVDIALEDSAVYKQALDMKILFASEGLKNHEDSLKFCTTLEGLYQKNKNSDVLFSQLAALYQALGQPERGSQMIADRLAVDPNNYTALVLKAQADMNAKKYDEAIDGFKKALSIKDGDALVYAYLGFIYNSKATESQSAADQKKFFNEGLPYLEKARELDPDRERANWAYPLYQTYYSIYGENDSRTQAVNKLIK